MNVLLINPNVSPESPWATKESTPPIGLMYIAAVLEKSGYNLKIIDAKLENLCQMKLSKKIINFNPDIVGITTDSCNFIESLKIAKVAKNSSDTIIIMGGPHVTVMTSEVIQYPEVDIAVIGEGEYTMLDIVQRIEKGKSLKGCKGTWIKEDGKIIQNPLRARIDLDELPFPARHLIPMEKYSRTYTLSGLTEPVDCVNTSRGCPYNCSFCSSRIIWGRKHKARSPKNVVNEIEYLIKEYGTKGIYFREDNFTLNRERVIGICEEIQRRKIKITWECSSRVDLVDKSLLRAMYRAGCRAIWYGIESGSPRILDILYKHITVDQSKEAIRLTREAGIKTGGSFIIGIPGETMEDIKLTLNLIKDLHCETTAYHYFYAIPVSKLYLEVKERRMIDSVYGDILFVKNDKFDRDSLTRLINQSREEIYGDQMQNGVILKIYQQIKQLIPMAVRLHLRRLKQRITNECFVKWLNLQFTQAKNRFNGWKNNFKAKRYYGTHWYEDVCKYFGISKEEAFKRATSPNRKSKLIWKNKEEIEKSERNVIDAWKKDENMVIRNSWYRERNIETRWDKMLKNLNYKKGERILDYGCGVSSFTKWALEHEKFDITLAEIDGPMLKFCKWRYGKKVSYCKIRPGKEGLPLKEEYDIILCLDMLEHVWGPLVVVKHLYSHLNDQGRLIETYINDSSESNLRKANRERPFVLNYLKDNCKLISGILESEGPRIWLKDNII